MVTQPTTNLKILTGVKINNTYTNTIFFSSLSEQTKYFSGKAKYSTNDLSYQRYGINRVRVGYKIANLYDCNYIMFQNTGFDNKWFYAFITNLHFINENCTEIEYELDVIQTWFFDFNIQKCWIDREHSTTDELYEHLEPEPIGANNYTNNLFADLSDQWGVDGTWYANIYYHYKGVEGQIVGYDISFGAQETDINTGIYSGDAVVSYPLSTDKQLEELNNYINTIVEANQADSITAITFTPFSIEFWLSPERGDLTYTLPENQTIGSYLPKNKKLLCSMYRMFKLECGGQHGFFKPELFRSKKIEFSTIIGPTPDSEVWIVPLGYDGRIDRPVRTDTGYKNRVTYCNFENALVLPPFPLVSFNIDTYKAYLAQNAGGAGLALQGLSSLFGAGMQAGTAKTGGSVLSTIVGGAFNLADFTLDQVIKANEPPQQKAGMGVNTLIPYRGYYPSLRIVYPVREELETIDNFFSRYGYACNKLKHPNISSRRHWNYTKTVDANIVGSIPTDDAYKIAGLFNKGLTFWKNGDNVGNYDLDNTV